jgi:TRAP-type C4-dicarboxylate transport system substrate-binding protein
MPCVALASGRVWKGLPEADRELITRLTKAALDEQIDATVANEPKRLEEFGKAITIKDVQVADTGKIIEAYDKIWLPKAPVLAELRKVGATL